MKSKLFLLLTFSGITPIIILFCILYITFLSYQKNPLQYYSQYAHSSAVSYAALPTNEGEFSHSVVAKEARVEILRQFFRKYKSPLEEEAQTMIDTADKYELDYRLLPAIAMQESHVCLRAPKDSNNCWGFGIYGGKVTRFETLSDAIEAVAKTLAVKYRDTHGLVTPEEVVRLYTPSDNGKWVYAVNLFMNRLQ